MFRFFYLKVDWTYIMDRLDRKVTAQGYREGAEQTERAAVGLEVAAIILENLDLFKNPLGSLEIIEGRLREAGYNPQHVIHLKAHATETVRETATKERAIADGMNATANTLDQLPGGPPPPPPPAPSDLGHPETRGGLGFLTN